MAKIPCYLLECVGLKRVELTESTCSKCDPCPKSEWGHHASLHYGDLQEGQDTSGIMHDPSIVWPMTCEYCGADMSGKERSHGLNISRLYRREESDEVLTLRGVGPGAMWRATWLQDEYQSQDDGAPLMVRTPGGDWIIDSQANNCTIPDDRRQEHHHCWPRKGVPPLIDVRKEYAPTCHAGAGSIVCGGFHGWLHDGHLEDC